MKKTSAGLIIYKFEGSQPKVLLVHMGGPFFAKKDRGAWTIPKGEYGAEETPKEVAIREFEEELGQAPPEGELTGLGEIEQKSKLVKVWAVEGDLDVSNIKSNTFNLEWPPRSGRIQEFPEIDKAGWFTLVEAEEKMIAGQQEILARLANELKIPFGAEKIADQPQQSSLF